MPADKFKVKLTGWDKLHDAFVRGDVETKKAIKAGVFAVLNNILTESRRRVPVDHGTLRASGFVTPFEGNTIRIGYGGPAEAYALAQHEGFFDHPGGGERKFLEGPLREAAPHFVRDVGRIAKQLLGGKGRK